LDDQSIQHPIKMSLTEAAAKYTYGHLLRTV